MSSDEYVLANRADDGPCVSGSVREECRECGEDVCLSPATIESREQGVYPDEAVCVPCALPEET